MLVVATAIVRDGRVLAGLRVRGGWEFPGGKVEPGEAPAAAVVRECREELGVVVEPLGELGSVTDGALELQLWHARLVDGIPAAGADHTALRWLSADDLDDVDWLPVDRRLLEVIRPLLA